MMKFADKKLSYSNLSIVIVFAVLFIIFAPIATYSGQKENLGINLENYGYPFPVRSYEFESQGQLQEMAYMYEEPEESNGRTVLLLHGKNFCGAYWGDTIKALKDNGFNVLVPDQTGFCKSTKPAYYQYSFQQLAQNTRQLMEYLGIEKTTVVGHSMGGMLATRFDLMYPQNVNKLILENPIGLEDWKLKVPYVDIDYWYKKELNRDFKGVKSYMKKNYFDGKWSEKYNEWVYLLTGMTESSDYPRYAWNSALVYDMIFTQLVLYEFENLKVPTVMIIGQRDRTALGKNLVDDAVAQEMGDYPQLGRNVCSRIPDSSLVELEDTGHLPPYRKIPAFYRKT